MVGDEPHWEGPCICAPASRHDPTDMKESTGMVKQMDEIVSLVLPLIMTLLAGGSQTGREKNLGAGREVPCRYHVYFIHLVPSTVSSTNKCF